VAVHVTARRLNSLSRLGGNTGDFRFGSAPTSGRSGLPWMGMNLQILVTTVEFGVAYHAATLVNFLHEIGVSEAVVSDQRVGVAGLEG
jgi:hypothetical protein